MSVDLLHAQFLYKRPTAKRGGCAAAEKSGGCFLRYGVSGFSLTSCGALWALLAKIIPNSE